MGCRIRFLILCGSPLVIFDMYYKYELHCHTGEVSSCADAPAEQTVKRYKELGYSGIVITDHFSPLTFPASKLFCPQRAADYYLSGYRAALGAAGDNFTVLLGMEIRFFATPNDYLVYGMTEDFIKNSKNLLFSSLKKLHNMLDNKSMLLVQAHPFRGYVRRANPEYLDGAEVFNGKSKNDEENQNALQWAESNGFKILTSGSDYHHLSNKINGGIETDEKIKTNQDLIRVLKSGNYNLIKGDI